MKKNIEKDEPFEFGRKVLKGYRTLRVCNSALVMNQDFIDKTADDTEIEWFFKNRRVSETNNEEEQILLNERINAKILEVFRMMYKKHHNGKTRLYIRILSDAYVTTEYHSNEEIAKKNNISIATLYRKKRNAIKMFGECLIEMYGDGILKYE